MAVAPICASAENCAEKRTLDFKVATVDGVKGVWLSTADANRVVFVLSECLPKYERLFNAQAQLIDLQTRTIRTSSQTVQLANEIRIDERARGDFYKTAFAEEHTARMAELAAGDNVFRSPVFWFAFGVLVAGGAAIGLAHGLKGAQ